MIFEVSIRDLAFRALHLQGRILGMLLPRFFPRSFVTRIAGMATRKMGLHDAGQLAPIRN